jgi:hypothetical protein
MRLLTKGDILSKNEYAEARPDLRRRVMVTKNKRRVLVGEHCTVHFECRDTMHYQVHEMLRAEDSWERAGAVEDELEAYNPLIPGPGELSATIMFEYETVEEREEFLPKFVGIDQHVWLQVGDTERVLALFDRGQIDEHKVSSVQYIKWKLDDTRCALLKQEGTVVRVVVDHPFYQAQSVLSEQARAEISRDPD